VIPTPWEFALLALAAFFIWYLIGEAEIFERPRIWLDVRLGPTFASLIRCPWCAGAWIVGAGWGLGWLIFPTETVWLAVPFAGMTVVGFLGTLFHALAD
jgi:hypothetical protein